MSYITMPEGRYTIRESAKILGTSPQQLYRLIREKKAYADVDCVGQFRMSVSETYRLLMNKD